MNHNHRFKYITYVHVYTYDHNTDFVILVVQVTVYRVTDEAQLFTPGGSPGAGLVLLERQQVSAYTGQWIVFKSSLKDVAKDWIRHPQTNKGNF